MSHLSAAQVEQLKLIGAELSEHRQKVKVSLDEISSKTYIPVRILLAVERAQAESLPEPVFVQGFIRRYGDAIGLNGKLIADRLVLDPQTFEIKPAGSLSALPTPKGFGKAESQNGTSRATRTMYAHQAAAPGPTAAETTTKLKPFTRKPIPWMTVFPVLAGLGIVAAIAGFGPQLIAQFQPAPAPKMTQAKAPTKTTKATAKATAKVPAKALKAVVSANNEAWMSVTVDGKPAYTATVAKGFQQTWNAKQQIVIETGNAGAVMVALNSQKSQALGKLGEVKVVKLSANGIQPQ
jgi:cytoskeleton protein RodZ